MVDSIIVVHSTLFSLGVGTHNGLLFLTFNLINMDEFKHFKDYNNTDDTDTTPDDSLYDDYIGEFPERSPGGCIWPILIFLFILLIILKECNFDNHI
jgi:hypothetical protein